MAEPLPQSDGVPTGLYYPGQALLSDLGLLQLRVLKSGCHHLSFGLPDRVDSLCGLVDTCVVLRRT